MKKVEWTKDIYLVYLMIYLFILFYFSPTRCDFKICPHTTEEVFGLA